MGSFNIDMIAAVRDIRDSLTGTKEIRIVPSQCLRADTGAPLAVFADGASAVPGVQITDSKTFPVRWNNHATPTEIAVNVPLPYDFDPSMPATLIFSVSKTGATVGDATSVTVFAYAAKTGALHDADANFGGATGAVDGDATAKTVSTLTRTLAAADLTAALGSAPLGSSESAWLSLVFGPTDGTLGTDDFLLHGVTLRYSSRYPSA